MAKQSGGTLLSIVTFIFKGVGLMAAFVAIATVGWHGAVAYYDLSGKVSAIHLSAKASEQALEITDLRSKLADRDTLIASLEQRLVHARSTPTDKDWEKTNHACLMLYSGVQSTGYQIATDLLGVVSSFAPAAQRYFDFTKPDSAMIQSIKTTEDLEKFKKDLDQINRDFGAAMNGLNNSYTRVAANLGKHRDNFYAMMFGAGLVETVTQNDTVYVVLTKYPYFGVNSLTGDFKELTPSTKPSIATRPGN